MSSATTESPQNPWHRYRADLEYRIVHVTTSGHKVHHADELRYAADVDLAGRARPERVTLGRPRCGSERWGTYRNGAVVRRPISCGRCTPNPEHCVVCADSRAE